MTSSPPTTTATTIPLVFSDGDRQIDAGAIPIHPSLSFPKFQSLVAQKLGLAPHQISTSLVRSKKFRNNSLRRKTPLDHSTDFSALSKLRDCFLLALPRRPSRRPSKKSPPPPVPVILRRADPPPPPPAAEGLGFWDYESQLRNLQMQRERYLLSMNYSYPEAEDSSTVVCEECEAGRASEFHSCVYDKVTFGFRSSVGPIQRPPKS